MVYTLAGVFLTIARTRNLSVLMGDALSNDQAKSASRSCCSSHVSSGDLISRHKFNSSADSRHCHLYEYEDSFT